MSKMSYFCYFSVIWVSAQIILFSLLPLSNHFRSRLFPFLIFYWSKIYINIEFLTLLCCVLTQQERKKRWKCHHIEFHVDVIKARTVPSWWNWKVPWIHCKGEWRKLYTQKDNVEILIIIFSPLNSLGSLSFCLLLEDLQELRKLWYKRPFYNVKHTFLTRPC